MASFVTSWRDMNRRCRQTNHKEFGRYGATGITVCDRWRVFANFLADMGPRPIGRTLDRIENSKGYYKDNCRWATPKEQTLNRAKTKWVTVNGERLCVTDWARRLGIHHTTFYQAAKRLQRPVEEICFERVIASL